MPVTPPFQNTPLAWYGADLANDPAQWIIFLTKPEIAELESTANRFKDLGLTIVEITKTNFLIPRLEPKIQELAARLNHGKGFVVLKRLPVEQYSSELAAMMFYGIGVHLGNPRMQNAKGHVLGHVKDIGLSSDANDVRIYQTRERQTFHTDSSDVVGLICLRKARQGGESLLVSGITIYNEMLSRWPNLVKLLFEPLATDRRGEIPQGMAPYFSIPVFNWHRNYLTVMYQRQYIDSAQRFESAMKLTQAHIDALDKFDELANDPRLNLAMQLEPGDMQFVYNHGLLHDRTAFVDYPDSGRRRHLLRLWLSLSHDRPLPAVFAQRFGDLETGSRGGISLKGVKATAPLFAE